MAGEASLTEAATYPRGFARDTAWKWPMVPARKLVTLNYGRALKADGRSPGNIPVFGTNGQCGWHNAPLAKAPGLILGRKGQGPLGVEWCDQDFWVIDTAYYASTLTPDLDLKYLYHLIKHIGLNHLKDGTSNPTLSRDTFGAQLFPVPPLAEQKAIAAVLGALDDKIELNRRMNATLAAMARALFQSWFVDFDPVRAKLDSRPPVGLDPATAALFPEHFAHGEHDMLPVGWRLAAIEDVCAINAWTLSKNDDLETLEYVEISEVSRGNIANIATYPRGEEPSRARRRLRHGDTVLSTVRPDRGSYFLALNPPANRVVSTGFAVLTPTIVPWSFLHAALTLPEVSDHLGQMADGGAYPAVRPEVIGAMQVALPNAPKILEAFHRRCAPLFEQAEANRNQSRTLATLRDTLLPKLLSGELSVAAARIETGAIS